MLEVLARPPARSYITFPGYRAGMKPANAGHTYPAEVLTRGETQPAARRRLFAPR